jgi:hypothetical protein
MHTGHLFFEPVWGGPLNGFRSDSEIQDLFQNGDYLMFELHGGWSSLFPRNEIDDDLGSQMGPKKGKRKGIHSPDRPDALP